MKKTLLFSALLHTMTMTQISIAQVQRDWATKFLGPGQDNAVGIAVDNSGNIWVCGTSNWSGSSSDIYTVKYNSAGVQTAATFFNSPFNHSDEARGIAIDPAGNVYVIGRVTKIVAPNTTSSDIVVLKYNSSAALQWSAIFNTPQNWIDDANAIAVDNTGNVYITGSVVKDAPFEYDYLTAKFNTSGVLQWFVTYNGTANGVDMAKDIAVDASGNVYITGSSHGQKGNLYIINTFADYVTIKYNTNGVQQWVARYNAFNQGDDARSLALDAAGNVYVTGRSAAANGNQDWATIKYSNAGIFQWSQRFTGPGGGTDDATTIAVDGSGNAIVAGNTFTSAGKINTLAIKYNSSGAQQWQAIYNAGTNDLGQSMALDHNGNVYVSAESYGSATLTDMVTVKFNATNGTLAWSTRFNGTENLSDLPRAIAVVNPSLAGNPVLYVFGNTATDVVTIKYSQPQVPQPSALQSVTREDASDKNFKITHQPNPVSSFANIQFDLPTDSRVTIDIYDASGRKVYTLINGFRKAGTHMTKLNASNFAEGLYYYKIYAKAGTKEFRQTKTLVIQR